MSRDVATVGLPYAGVLVLVAGDAAIAEVVQYLLLDVLFENGSLALNCCKIETLCKNGNTLSQRYQTMGRRAFNQNSMRTVIKGWEIVSWENCDQQGEHSSTRYVCLFKRSKP